MGEMFVNWRQLLNLETLVSINLHKMCQSPFVVQNLSSTSANHCVIRVVRTVHVQYSTYSSLHAARVTRTILTVCIFKRRFSSFRVLY